MKSITLYFTTNATRSVSLETDGVLQQVLGLVRGCVSRDPSITQDSIVTGIPDSTSLDWIAFTNSGQSLGIPLRKNDQIFISPLTADLPGWVQLWYDESSADELGFG